jgi:hypothetical protein
LDTVKGCLFCNRENPFGCYNNCYAANIASRYGFDFSRPVTRDFVRDETQPYLFSGMVDTKHRDGVIQRIRKMKMPFVRIGEMGDPSENWQHTLNICRAIKSAMKSIVIITKHLKSLSQEMLNELWNLDVCINTSISALDSQGEIDRKIVQYHKLKGYCNSVLRVVSCDFNLANPQGKKLAMIQQWIFKNTKVIDTVFRTNKNNPLVVAGIIKVKKVKFLKSMSLASIFNSRAFLGRCEDCPDMCGINLM